MQRLESVLWRGIQSHQQHRLLQSQVQLSDLGVDRPLQNPWQRAHRVFLALTLLYSWLSFLNYNSLGHAEHFDAGRGGNEIYFDLIARNFSNGAIDS